MGHGGYGKRSAAERNPPSRRTKPLSAVNKSRSVTLKNQIRSAERILRKDLPPEVRDAQIKKLGELKEQQELHNRLAVERKIFMRYRKIRFFERRKIERRIRRLEKKLRTFSGQETDDSEQLAKLKEDLEYIRYFPKGEKYVSLFMGGDDLSVVDKRNQLRKKIKANIVAAAASGKDLEETGSEDDGLMYPSDDFFSHGSSSDEADADDEWTDKSTREQASSASNKATTSGMSSDDKHQAPPAHALMRPPRPLVNSLKKTNYTHASRGASSSRNTSFGRAEIPTSSKNTSFERAGTPTSSKNASFGRAEISTSSKNASFERAEISTSSNTSNGRGDSQFPSRASSNSVIGPSSNLSSNSDAHKPRRKRRPKKKKQQTAQ